MNRLFKCIATILFMAFVLSLGMIPATAESAKSKTAITKHVLDAASLRLTRSDIQDYQSFAQSLAEELKKSAMTNYDLTVQEFVKARQNPFLQKLKEFTRRSAAKGGLISVSPSTTFTDTYTQEYQISESSYLTVTPTFFVIDTITEGTETTEDTIPMAAAAISSKKGTSSKTYYGLLGNKLFALSVTCEFYYDGSKATYKSGLDYYYTKGTLSIWQVSNWKGGSEACGTNNTSYRAYCAGNFHYGFEYEGNGLVIQDVYCKNTVTCNKSGTISKTAKRS